MVFNRLCVEKCWPTVSISTTQPIPKEGETVYRTFPVISSCEHDWYEMDTSRISGFHVDRAQQCIRCGRKRKSYVGKSQWVYELNQDKKVEE